MLHRLVDVVGPSKALAQRDLSEKLISQVEQHSRVLGETSLSPLQAVAFTRDSTPGPRQHGKNILIALSKDHENFSRTVSKMCSDADCRHVQSIVDKAS